VLDSPAVGTRPQRSPCHVGPARMAQA
jgi:hypothetical protein